MNWICLKDRVPSKDELLDNWKFIVCHTDDGWVDMASYECGLWHNGECNVYPTHFAELPPLPG